jgi:hypothetical protein
MDKTKRPNIYWFIIDSVRTFKTGMDDRDYIDVLDNVRKDSVYFNNCYTSAPSSLLAAGALYTGYPSSFVARHFNDWKFKDNNISTIKTLVEERGYTSIPILDSREVREKYQFLLPPFPGKFLPKGRRLYDYVWTNEEITDIFKHIYNSKKVSAPYIYTFWYDCRRDPTVSQQVQRAIDLIKENGDYDNSIIILNSDHGYPDPNASLDESFFKELGHDMVLTDDNIKTPLVIKYPNCPKEKEISNVVGHVDILPTIFDIIDFPLNKSKDFGKYRGKSLLPIINGTEKDNRIRRSDTRLQMDKGKITALRYRNFKYIYFHDNKEELLFDILYDPQELEDVSIKHPSILAKFNEELKDYNIELSSFYKEGLNAAFNKAYHDINLSKVKINKALVVSPAPEDLINYLTTFLKLKNKLVTIDLLNTGSFDSKNGSINRYLEIDDFSIENLNKLELEDYDLIIYLTHNSRRVFLKNDIVKFIKKIKSNKKVLMNYNFEIFEYFSIKSFFSYIILFFDWDVKGYFYKQEPSYFFRDVYLYLKHGLKVLFREKKMKNNDLLTAREIMDYRKGHLRNEKKGVGAMTKEEMKYEVKRIEEWGKE